MIHCALAPLLLLAAAAQDAQETEKIIKGRATLLRTALKPHAAFLGFDAARGELRLRAENDAQEKTWPVDPDAEVRVQGGWGGLEDLAKGDRVWAWIRLDRESKPRSIFLIADEISEQDIHQVPWTLAAADPEKREVVVRRKLDGKAEETRTLKVAAPLEMSKEGADAVFRGPSPVRVKPEGTVYVQTSGGELRRIAGPDELAALKEAQRDRLEARLRKEGLPGTIGSLHAPVGEIEILLDHEAMRWGRSLKSRDRVKLALAPPVEAVVLDVQPWNEKTRLTLAASGRDLADLQPGRRIRIAVPEPPAEVLHARIPPDAGRPRAGAARAEWFLASTYCSCSIAGDGCTGMFYTLAACNSMTCGMPNRVRKLVNPLLEKGASDKEVLEAMEKEFGAGIWKPHLLK